MFEAFLLQRKKQTDFFGAGPGPKKLIGGDENAGFFGEVSVAELIDGAALATLCGLTAGVAVNTTTGWLKFVIDKKIVYYSKKVYRRNLSWQHLSTANIVAGTLTRSIGGTAYLVGVPRGLNPNLSIPFSAATNSQSALDCEWSKLMYPITNNTYKPSQGFVNWANYTDEELGNSTNSATGNAKTICKETPPAPRAGTERIFRGGANTGVVAIDAYASNGSYSDGGWRPRLELILP